MNKDFKKWHDKKTHLHDKGSRVFFHEREVWWCTLGVNVGVETDGKHASFERPALVVKKFNADMFWGLPLTSRERSGKFFKVVRYEGGSSTASFPNSET